MDRIIDYFHKKYYPDLNIEEVASAMQHPLVQENAVRHIQQNHYPDMSVNQVASQIYNQQPMSMGEMGGVQPSGGVEPTREADTFLAERKHKKGHLTMSEAMDYIDKKQLKGDDAYKFLREWSPSTISTMYSPQGLERTMRNPDYKAPITKQELDDYELYNREIEKRKADSTPAELEAYLNQNKYTAKKPLTTTGKQIIENAKSKSNKVRMEENPDGSYTVYDDESTFKDTEAPFGKGTRIYPDAKYSKTLYGKGKDLRNVYKPIEYAPHKGRIPTEQERAAYTEGNYATGAMSPEYKYYYANAYLKPNEDKTLMSSKEKPFYAADSSEEDVNRLEKVNQMKEQMNEAHQGYLKKKARQEKRQEFMKRFKSSGKGGRGYDLGTTIGEVKS